MTTPASGSYAPKLNNVRGILWMLLAVTTLTTMFVVVKQMAIELPIFVVAIARTFFADSYSSSICACSAASCMRRACRLAREG